MRYRGASLAAGLAAIWGIWAAALVAKGGLLVAKHEGDAMHLAEIVLREAGGAWPHLDFMTPIGLLATWPIAAFVEAGMGLGSAVLAAQAAVALALLPAAWWVGLSRLPRGWGLLFGGIVVALVCAVVHGEAERSLSISMHYNRWAWAIAFCVLAVAVLPPRFRQGAVADGLVLGLGIAALALVKATYVVAFLPAVLVSLALRRDRRALVVALGAGLAVVAALTVAAGPAFWPAYLGDLLATARSGIRSAPGDSLGGVIAAPAYVGGSLVALAGVILLRRAGRAQEGAVLLVALPGFFYVTFQNYGNDPQWLYFVGLLLLALRPDEAALASMRQGLTLAGLAAFVLALPSALNLASSPFRHLTTPAEGYRPLLPGRPDHADLMIDADRADRVAGKVPLPGFDGLEEAPTVLNGETLAECRLDQGTVALFARMASEVEAAGAAGRRLATADLFNALWLFGDFPPLTGGAPWYYGGFPGGENAELLLVPTCPVLPPAQRAVLDAVTERGWTLAEVARGDTWILTEIQRP